MKTQNNHENKSWVDVINKIKKTISTSEGKNRIASIGGSSFTNESIYAWNQFLSSVIQTENINSNLDSEVNLNLIDIDRVSTINNSLKPNSILIWAAPDPKETMPVLYLRIKEAVKNSNLKIINIAMTPIA